MFQMQRVFRSLACIPCLILALLTPASLGQEPIPTGEDQRTYSQFREALLKNELRRVDEYRQHSKSPEELQNRVAGYITTVYSRTVYNWGVDWEQLIDEGMELLKEDKSLMVVDATAQAIAQATVALKTTQAAKQQALKKKEEALRKQFRSRFDSEQGYSDAWWIHNEIRFRKVSSWSKATTNRLIELTAKWLGKQRDEGVNLRVAYQLFLRTNSALPEPADRMRLRQRCLKVPKLDPWISAMIGAKNQKNLAWKARGTGYASEITKENYKKFLKHQKGARGLLQQALTLHPSFPEPAALLINNATSAGGDKSPRHWFDQAVAAEMDNAHAYAALASSLQPRWGGSHQQMIDFALECAATERYDSDAPYQCVTVLMNMANAMPEAEKKEFLRQPAIYGAIKDVLLGMANTPSREDNDTCKHPRESCLVKLMEIANDADQFADVAQIRRELGESFDPSWFERSMAVKISAACAKASNVGDDVLKAQELTASTTDRVNAERLRESLDLLKLAKNDCDNPDADLYFAHQLKKTQNELLFQSGETVPLTFTRELPDWIQDGNQWKVVDRHTILGDCRDAGENSTLALVNASLFPTPFIFEAEVKLSKTKFRNFSPALLVGTREYSYFRKGFWTEPDSKKQNIRRNGRVIWFNPKSGDHGDDQGAAQYGPGRRSIPKPLPNHKLEKDTHQITVVAYKDQLIYYIDGRRGGPVTHGLDESPLGIGSKLRDAKSGAARYRNLTVRKLQSKSPWLDPQGGIDFYTELIENYPHLVDSYYRRAEAWFASGQYDKAMLDLHKHRKLTGNAFAGPSFELLGKLLKRQGRFGDAIRIFEHQLQSPDQAVRYSAALKLVEIRAGAPDKAIRDGKLALQYAVIAERNESATLNNSKVAFAIAYAEQGNLEKAKTYSDLALENAGVDLAYCEPMIQQIEKDGHYRLKVEPSQNATLPFKEILGRELPAPASGTTAKNMADAGKTGQYLLKTKGVPSILVQQCLTQYRTKTNKGFAAKLLKEKEVSLPGVGEPSWQVYVPEGYSADALPAFGMMVFLNGEGPTGIIPDESFRKVLDEQRIIFVSPNKTNRQTPPFIRRSLTIEAIRVIRQRYRINSDNVFLGGVGNGSTDAYYTMASNPGVFRGGFLCDKALGLSRLIRKVRLTQKGPVASRSRYFFHTGETARKKLVLEPYQDYLDKGLKNVELQLAKNAKGNLPNATELERGIQFLKHREEPEGNEELEEQVQ